MRRSPPRPSLTRESRRGDAACIGRVRGAPSAVPCTACALPDPEAAATEAVISSLSPPPPRRRRRRAGLRTIDDLRGWDQLTDVQRIGLKYYNDTCVRIPRAEARAVLDFSPFVSFRRLQASIYLLPAFSSGSRRPPTIPPKSPFQVEEIFAVVRDAAVRCCPAGSAPEAEACGSFRRGKESSADVDVLITHRGGGREWETLLAKILAALREQGARRFSFPALRCVAFRRAARRLLCFCGAIRAVGLRPSIMSAAFSLDL